MAQPHLDLDKVTESATAKVLTHVVLGMLPIMLAVLGYLLVQANNRIESTQASQGRDLSQMKSDVRDINTRLDAQVIRTVDTHSKQIDQLSDRVSTLERAVRVP